VGTSPLPEHSSHLHPATPVTGGELDYDAYDNGGQWLNAVFPTGPDHHLAGFVHAEDHFWLPSQASLTGLGWAILMLCGTGSQAGGSWLPPI